MHKWNNLPSMHMNYNMLWIFFGSVLVLNLLFITITMTITGRQLKIRRCMHAEWCICKTWDLTSYLAIQVFPFSSNRLMTQLLNSLSQNRFLFFPALIFINYLGISYDAPHHTCLPFLLSNPPIKKKKKGKGKTPSSICIAHILIGAWSTSHWPAP